MVRGYEDVAVMAEKSSVVIWGAGSRGYMLLQEIRMNRVKNVYIFDKDELKIKDLDERITLEQIRREIDKFSFVVTAQADKAAGEISGQIRQYNKDAEIYRYEPKDWRYLDKILTEKGFFNGYERCKPLSNEDAKKLLKQMINGSRPFLCARWGGVEGEAVYAEASGGWYADAQISQLKSNAGFYPLDRASLHKFAECSMDAAKEIDMLAAGCWCTRIDELYKLYSPRAVLVRGALMAPFWDDVAWSGALARKKVLVIHPFAKLIEEQYKRRDKLFSSPNILPEFELITYPAVQSIGGNPEFESWFDALDKMKNDISGIDFDVALIGCGAYGMPLGAFIKAHMHKKAVHMGGALQILFGIRGKRWDEREDYSELFNGYWVRPTDDLKPESYKNVEGGCYW